MLLGFYFVIKWVLLPSLITIFLGSALYSLQYFIWPRFLSTGQWVEILCAIFLSLVATFATHQAKTFAKANKVLKFAIENPTLDPKGTETAKQLQPILLRRLGGCVLVCRFCKLIVWFIGLIFLLHAILRFIF